MENDKIWVNDNIAGYAKQFKDLANVGEIFFFLNGGQIILRLTSSLGKFLSQEISHCNVVWKVTTLQL